MNYSDYRVRKYWGEKQNLFNIFTIWGFGTACKGRTYKIYSLKVGFNKIIAQLENQQKKAVNETQENIERLRNLGK